MHLRSPSMAPGTRAFVWALVFAIYIWAFMLGVGSSDAVAALLGAIAGGIVFLFVRHRGEDLARRRRARGSRS
jgi:membrane associated rhomboid family serine protease